MRQQQGQGEAGHILSHANATLMSFYIVPPLDLTIQVLISFYTRLVSTSSCLWYAFLRRVNQYMHYNVLIAPLRLSTHVQLHVKYTVNASVNLKISQSHLIFSKSATV